MLFGTAGIPHTAEKKDSISGIKEISKLGLDAMELEFVYGIKMSEQLAKKNKEEAVSKNISLSVHAPYYINLNAKDKRKLGLSKHNILQSCRVGHLASAKIVVFHPGFYLGEDKKKVYENIKSILVELTDILKSEKIEIKLGLETTGKVSAFGTLEEILSLSEEVKNVFPVVDFAHLHARGNGLFKTQKDVDNVLEKIPKRFLKDLHIHMSGINYSEKGERNHLNLQDKDNTLDFKIILRSLKSFNVSGTIISESPNLEDDALVMKRFWESLD
ncbi:MAG: TIM barrel protein [Candidatus Diapherotrites archaeon]|nr:TIM barrel protein [Candidatus Diapherotrites archaeon]